MGEAEPVKTEANAKLPTKIAKIAKIAQPNNKEYRPAPERMRKKRFLNAANHEFNIDVIQTQFLNTPLSEAGGLINESVIATLSTFRLVVKDGVKKSGELPPVTKEPTSAETGPINARNKNLKRAYMKPTSKTEVQTGGGNKYRALLNTNEEVNMITHDIVKAEERRMRR